MSGFNFEVKRVEAGQCTVPDCTFTARNEVRMFFPCEAGPFKVCGHHKAWAKEQCREASGE